jgi:hypothetical protein
MTPCTPGVKPVELGIIALANYCFGVSDVAVPIVDFGLGAYAV